MVQAGEAEERQRLGVAADEGHPAPVERRVEHDLPRAALLQTAPKGSGDVGWPGEREAAGATV